MCVCFALIYNKCGEYRFVWVFTFNSFFFENGFPFYFCCSKTVRCLCVCNFGGIGYGFFDLWIQFREYAFDDANVLENSTLPFWWGVVLFSNIVTSAYAWVWDHHLPLSGFIVTTPPFTVLVGLLSLNLCRSYDGMQTL